MSYDGLTHALDAAGLAWWALNGRDGGGIVVTQHGARVLGLFVGDQPGNMLWTNPSLERHPLDAWHSDWNLGGDRTWIAPEIDFFFPKIGANDPSEYAVQTSMDPGSYRLVAKTDERIVLAQEANVVNHRTGEAIPLHIERDVSVTPSPFHEKERVLREIGPIDYFGYQLKVTLSAAARLRSDPVGIWNLIQVPAGGVIRVPTWGPVEPMVVFGDAGPVVEATERGIDFRVDGKNRCKISVPAYAVAGRIGYRRELGDGQATLLIRQIVVNPSGAYVDAPWEAPADRGYAVQCYGDDGAIGAFGELEHHAPAAASSCDTSQVWCFVGLTDAIDRLERLLMG